MSEQDANEQFGNFDNNESEGYESQSNSDFDSGSNGGFERQPSEQQSFGGGNESGQESLGDSQPGQAYGNNESQFGSQEQEEGF